MNRSFKKKKKKKTCGYTKHSHNTVCTFFLFFTYLPLEKTFGGIVDVYFIAI